MWEISNSGQLLSFFVSFIAGLCYALFYTLFKGIRRAFRHSNFAVFSEDIIFCVVTAFVTFLLFLAFSSGEIRFFMLLSMFLGFIAFYLTLSNFLSRVLSRTLQFFWKVVRRFFSLSGAALGIFFKTIGKTVSYCGKKLRICYKYLKKPLKHRV